MDAYFTDPDGDPMGSDPLGDGRYRAVSARWPSRCEAVDDRRGVSGDSLVGAVPPSVEQLPVGAGAERNLVAPDVVREAGDLLPVTGLFIVGDMAPLWPGVGLGIDVEKNRRESVVLLPGLDCGAQGQGVFHELRRIQVRVHVLVVAEQVADVLVADHPVSPDRSPEGVAEASVVAAAERLEPFAFDADQCGAGGHEAIGDGMPAAGPRKTDGALQRERTCWPARAFETRQGREVGGSVEEEAESVDRERGGGRGSVELGLVEFLAGRRVEDAFDVGAGDARQETVRRERG